MTFLKTERRHRGAPLNFAVHAHQLANNLGGGSGIIVSSINSDQRDNRIIDFLFRLGMSTRYAAKDYGHPTDHVSVFMSEGEPGYQIEPDVAWDFIPERPLLQNLANQCHAGCFQVLQPTRQVEARKTARNRRHEFHDADL
jgi:hypothetical protein